VRWILLPGLDGTGKLFAPLLEILPPHVQATVVSYPGNKKQSYDDLYRQVLTVLPSDEPFLLVAESFSGPIGIRIAAAAPKNLIGLALCASFATSPANTLEKALLSFLGGFMFKFHPPVWAVRRYLAGKNASPRLMQLFYDSIAQVSPGVMHDRLKMILKIDETENLHGITAPVLYLFGKQDKLVARKNFDLIATHLKQIKLREIDAPHFILQTAPAAALESLVEFSGG